MLRTVLRSFLAVMLLMAWSVAAAGGSRGTIRFVYVGGSNCGMCKKPQIKQNIAAMRDAARAWAASHGYSFETVGVATDTDKSLGERFLADCGVGPFDRTVSDQGFAGAEPFTEPYKRVDPNFSQGWPTTVAPQAILLFDDGAGSTPRQLLREIGTMIAQTPSGLVEKVLNASLK